MRLATTTQFDRALGNISQTQSNLAQLQSHISSALRVSAPSDDPVAAATAERSLARIAQLQAQQRALNVQRDAMTTAESSLGSATSLLQRFRQLTVSAGNATATPTDRTTMANEMASIRDQLVGIANTQDSHGVYLFSGWASSTAQGQASAPVAVGVAPGGANTYTYTGSNGQSDPTQTGVPYTLNGQAVFMQVPKGNGVFDVALGASNAGQLSTTPGQFSISPPGGAMSNRYQIQFLTNPVPGGAPFTYSVLDVTNPAAPVAVGPSQPYTAGQTIAFSAPNAAGSTETVSVQVNGTPQAGDALTITPYDPPGGPNPANDSLFALLDRTIAGVKSAVSTSPGLLQTVAQGLSQLDAGLDSVSTARAQTGLWLNRADGLNSANEQQSTQLEQDRSKAQDLDMVSAISQMTQQTTGYQAALQSYAAIQKMSLFDFIR